MEGSVEINYPLDVTGSSRDDRVTVTDVKDFNISANSLESKSTTLDIFPDSQLCRDSSLPSSSSFFSVDVSKQQFHCRGRTECVVRTEEGKVQRRAGKVSRSSGYSKRPRIALLEDAESVDGVDDSKDLSNKNGLLPINCEAHDKAQLTKQKNLSGRRGDRRNFKVPLKTKCDSFSAKTDLAGFSSGIGGNNIFGLYGLKTDVDDITEAIDDLSLNDLLHGTHKSSSLGKEKGRKLTNVNENIMNSIRKACSILQSPRSSQSQSYMEIDTCTSEKMPLYNPTSVSVALNGENGDSPAEFVSASNKDWCSKAGAHDKFLDFPIYRPIETLDRLALPVPKDLESLLMEVPKPGASSKNASDLRPAKQMSRRASLPAFHWSNFGGHHRTNFDVKLLNSRATCQGRWVRIRNIASFSGLASNSFSDLESLKYDASLIPLCGPKSTIFENNISSICVPWRGCSSFLTSASATPTSQSPIDHGGDVKHEVEGELCPGILAAAQTLCDLAIHTSRLCEDGIMRWPKKPSQKAMKARKSKSNDKHEDSLAASTSLMGGSISTLRNSSDLIVPSKRPKHSILENKKHLDHINGVKKGSISVGSLSSKFSDGMTETRHAAAYITKQPRMMPPPDKVLNRMCNGQQKVRKMMQMDWKRDSDRQK